MAIAFDASASNTSSPAATWNHTCTGSNLKLFVGLTGAVSGTDNITAVTYNGVSLTKIGFIQKPGDRLISFWYLDGPATGTNVVAVVATGFYVGYSISYTGSASSLDSTGTPNTASAASTLSSSTTVVAANCWLVGIMGNNNGTQTAGTQTFQRVDDSAGSGTSMVDSNGTVSTGSQSMTVNRGGSNTWAGIVVSIAPTGGVVVNSGFFFAATS